jgi:hypothetical protein
MTPEQMDEFEILPTIGDTVDHLGKQYECVEVRWDREEDIIEVEYRRRYHADGTPLADPFAVRRGAQPTLTIVDEAAMLPQIWRDGATWKADQ